MTIMRSINKRKGFSESGKGGCKAFFFSGMLILSLAAIWLFAIYLPGKQAKEEACLLSASRSMESMIAESRLSESRESGEAILSLSDQAKLDISP